MSRRSNRRRSMAGAEASRGRKAAVRGSKAGIGRWSIRISAILALALILSGFGLYLWVQRYLHSDDFRVFMGDSVGQVMGSEAEFQRFEWQGMEAQTAGLQARGDGLMQRMDADGVQARLSLEGVRRGVWEISDLRVSQLDVELATAGARAGMDGSEDDSESEEWAGTAGGDSTSDEGGFLSSLLPDRSELVSAEVMRLRLALATSGGGMLARDLAMRVDRGHSEGSYDLSFSGGTVQSPWFGSVLDLRDAQARYKQGRLFLNRLDAKVYERGQLTLKGELEGGRFGFFGTLADVEAEELVPRDWRKRLSGEVASQFKVQSRRQGVETAGSIELKRGVLTGLPLLDRIAAYANTRRFQRLNLSEASLDFRRIGNRLELSDIKLASEGLVRLEGRLTVEDGRLDGRFRVGVMPGTLAHIPGAESKVFLRGEKGLLWSPLRVTGTVDAPKEDLSDRMIAAAGERMFELVPETGKMALKFAHDSATELPSKAVETGTEVIREGTGVIQEGVRGVFDLLPGGK